MQAQIASLPTRMVVMLGFLIVGLWLATPVVGQNKMDEALAQYQDGSYEASAQLFSEVAQDESYDKKVRAEALQYLGRAYIAGNHMAEARESVKKLLELEPPLIELNPDMEPPPLMSLYYEVRAAIEVPKPDPGMHTLAIMDFRNYAMNDHDTWDPMQWGFSSMMIEQMSGATDLKLVDRENLQWVLNELKIQEDLNRVDQSTAVRMGKLMGAQAMVFGGIYVQKKKLRLQARVVKVETGEILLSESVDGKTKDFSVLLEKLSLNVARSLNSTLGKTQIGARTETKSLDAMRAYSQGLALLEKNDYQGAYEKFLEAQTYDPSYKRAFVKAESLRPVLAAAGENTSNNRKGGPDIP